MRILIWALLLTLLIIVPFSIFKAPWAMRWWQRLRLVVVIYVIAIIVSAIVALVLRWDDIYG